MPRHCLSRTNTLALPARRRRRLMHQKRRVTRLAQQLRWWPWLRHRTAASPTVPAVGITQRSRAAARRVLNAACDPVAARFPFLPRWWRHVRLLPPHHGDGRYPRQGKSKAARNVLRWCWVALVLYGGFVFSNVLSLLDSDGVVQPAGHPSVILAALLTHTGTRTVEQQPVVGGLLLAAATAIVCAAAWAICDLRCEKEVVKQRKDQQLKAEARLEAREEARQVMQALARAYGIELPADVALVQVMVRLDSGVESEVGGGP